MATEKFSEFPLGLAFQDDDQVVGLRIGTNTRFAITIPWAVSLGGTGVVSPLAHSIPIGQGNSPFTFITLSDGKLLGGVSGGDPKAFTLTPGLNMISITTDVPAGTITVNAANKAITAYVVDPNGSADYTAIQSAVNAVITAGGGTIYVRPATYTENLDISAAVGLGISIVGITPLDTLVNDAFGDIAIVGVHIPPNDGFFTFSDLILQSSTHIFNSSAVGTAALSILDCSIRVSNGYAYNLPNWTGALYTDTAGDGSSNNGFVNNVSGTAFVAIHNSHVGAFGSSNVMMLGMGGSCSLVRSEIRCKINTPGTYTAYFCNFLNSVTFSNGCNAEMYFNLMTKFGEAAIHNNSSGGGGHIFMGNIVNCSNNPAIDGTGTDVLIQGGNTWFNNSNISGSFTVINKPTVVRDGGTGISSATAYGVICGGTTSAGPFQVVDPGPNGYVLTSHGLGAPLTFEPNGSGSGNVVGPVSSTTNAIARYADITGQLIANSSVFIDSSNNLNVERSDNGQPVVSQASNTSNTANSHAYLVAKVAGASSGNPLTQYVVTGGAVFSTGIDRSDSSKYKLSLGSALGTNDIFTVSSSTGGTTFGFSNLSVSRSASGSNVAFAVTNSSNTASSNAQLAAIVGGTSGGDPHTLYTVTGANSYITGIDTSAGSYKISLGGSLGTNDLLIVNDTGLIQIPTGDLNVSRSNPGGNVINEVINSSTAANSNAVNQMWVNGGAAGDPYFQYTINGITDVTSGLDNSDADAYVISNSSTIGTNNLLKITTTSIPGQCTLPQQTSFIAYNSTNRTNVTGDGTLYTAIFDQFTQVGSQYNNATGVFTAPVDGWYQFDTGVMISNIGALHASAWIELIVGGPSGLFYRGTYFNPAVVAASNQCMLQVSRMLYLTASTTVEVQIMVSGSTKTITVSGTNSPEFTSFSGGLIH